MRETFLTGWNGHSFFSQLLSYPFSQVPLGLQGTLMESGSKEGGLALSKDKGISIE